MAADQFFASGGPRLLLLGSAPQGREEEGDSVTA